MQYYLYEIKNNLNGKIYVGVHKTEDMNDGYMGSGKVIKRAIEKHGIENFTKTILETFENSEVMFEREKEVVTEEFLARDDVYNLRRGGTGGFDYINSKNLGVDISEINRVSPEVKRRSTESQIRMLTGIHSKKSRTKAHDILRTNQLGVYCQQVRLLGSIAATSTTAAEKRHKTFSEIEHQCGNKNSQFGTCWMWHELVGNKKCKKDMLPLFIEQGWIKGRIVLVVKSDITTSS